MGYKIVYFCRAFVFIALLWYLCELVVYGEIHQNSIDTFIDLFCSLWITYEHFMEAGE